MYNWSDELPVKSISRDVEQSNHSSEKPELFKGGAQAGACERSGSLIGWVCNLIGIQLLLI